MEEKRNNYLTARDRAKELFLGHDQETLIDKWGLEADKDFIYIDFFHRHYKLDRKNGDLINIETGVQGGFEETMSVFDLLCRESADGSKPRASIAFALTNSLEGRDAQTAVGTNYFTGPPALHFSRDTKAFKKACETCGGMVIPIGDIGYEFHVFSDLKLRLRFYEADDEFPATLDVLWTENALEYIHYETCFYTMNALMDMIRDEFDKITE